MLLLPPQLQKLTIEEFPELSLLSDSLEGGGLQGLRSLKFLKIWDCPKLLHSYSFSSIPFPTSLKELILMDCGEFRGEGIGPFLTSQSYGSLTPPTSSLVQSHLTRSFFPAPLHIRSLIWGQMILQGCLLLIAAAFSLPSSPP